MFAIPRRFSHFVFGIIQSGLTCFIAVGIASLPRCAGNQITAGYTGTRLTSVVHSDGSGLRQLPVSGPCGGLSADPTTIGCFDPIWSPDGEKIVFGRNADDDQRDLYTVNADGSGLFQVTHTPNISEFNGDWGTHPLTP